MAKNSKRKNRRKINCADIKSNRYYCIEFATACELDISAIVVVVVVDFVATSNRMERAKMKKTNDEKEERKC